MPRQLADNTEIRNIPLPKDALIICMIGAANRDLEFFTEPDRFNIYRELNHQKVFSTHSQNLSFGYGTHTCVGASLSLIQLELVANIILDKLKNLEYEKNFVYAEHGLYTRGPKSLKLEFRAS
ncbi:cytochrome P450 [Bacillus norwichensis]|uniref:Cytochrome P450 n=1 Tax=Bacillus norwichensis TaxID=2762217 RepID=A0ABR8VN23_9BACI|nr:cytochrome P450 [Bacillus norwichensis]